MTPEPAVACASPLFRRKRYPSGVLSARSLFATTLITLCIVAALRPKPKGCSGPSKVAIAQLTVKKYAYEAFPQWMADHPDRRCVKSLRELGRYMSEGDRVDPWGHKYAFTCERGAFYVASLGADGIAGTADDLWGHE